MDFNARESPPFRACRKAEVQEVALLNDAKDTSAITKMKAKSIKNINVSFLTAAKLAIK